MTPLADQLPLMGLRIVDSATGRADQVTRLLGDLGAAILKVEPPGGSPKRAQAPSIGGQGIAYALDNANKISVVLDPDNRADRDRFVELVGQADILVDSGRPGHCERYGRSTAALADRFDHLVALSVTDFGMHGPRSAWRATDAVLVAMSSVLSRSGAPDGPPVLPPDGIASATAAAQAAWTALVAYYQRLRTGRGDYIDFSRYEAVLQSLDPPFGAQGQAAAARGLTTARRGRPKSLDSYPIFACRDGWVRICILAPRQWRAMRAWLGEPSDFQDPKYDTIGARTVDFDKLRLLIADLFAEHTGEELVELGAVRGVPVAAVLTPAEVLTTEHFAAVSAWAEVDMPGAGTITVPDGSIIFDGQRAGVRWLAQSVGESVPVWPERQAPVVDHDVVPRPLEGLTVLDLGVIVAGGELGRLFADMGADVIKVESPSHPDGLRQARPGQLMSESFAWTHRNQQAMGLDLRSSGGPSVFGRLVEQADAVFANFKPGTLTSLGFSFTELQHLNPHIVLTESSAFGATGPWSTRMGYGPLVRASTGISRLWSNDDSTDSSIRYPFSDSVTVFPDHIVARLAAVATLAALIRRRVSGHGAYVHISQAEAAVSQLDTTYATVWAHAAGAGVTVDLPIHAVLPCAGDDEWCVLSIASDTDWAAVLQVSGGDVTGVDRRFADAHARWRNRGELTSLVGDFTQRFDAEVVSELFQKAGVPAAPMLRGADVPHDPQVRARGLYTDMAHPLFDVALPAETGPAPFRNIPPADLRPAPLLGENTIEVCRRLLSMENAEIERLIAEGVLFSAPTKEVDPV